MSNVELYLDLKTSTSYPPRQLGLNASATAKMSYMEENGDSFMCTGTLLNDRDDSSVIRISSPPTIVSPRHTPPTRWRRIGTLSLILAVVLTQQNQQLSN